MLNEKNVSAKLDAAFNIWFNVSSAAEKKIMSRRGKMIHSQLDKASVAYGALPSAIINRRTGQVKLLVARDAGSEYLELNLLGVGWPGVG